MLGLMFAEDAVAGRTTRAAYPLVTYPRPGSLDASGEPAGATDDSDAPAAMLQPCPVGSALGSSRSPAQVLHGRLAC